MGSHYSGSYTIKGCVKDQNLGYTPRSKFLHGPNASPLTIFVNKVLLEHGRAKLLTYYQWL